MSTSTSATKTSSDKAPAPPQTAAPQPTAQGGPMVQGMSPQDMQQRFGNQGTAEALNSQVPEDAEAKAVVTEAVAEEAIVMPEMEEIVDPPPILVDPATAVAPATAAVTDRATTSKKHDPVEVPVEAAQTAAEIPAVEAEQVAADETVGQIEEGSGETEDVDKETFKEELVAALDAVVPEIQSEDEAKDFVDNGAANATNAFTEQVGADPSEEASEPLVEAADPESEVESEGGDEEGPELVEEAVGEPAAPVSADSVVPSAYPDSQVDYSAYGGNTDALLAENSLTEEQLAKGNEPEFNAALEAKGAAEQHTQSAPTSYRETETNVRDGGRGTAVERLGGGIGSFNSTRRGEIGDVVADQGETKSADESKRQEIKDDIVEIKDDTTTDVNEILESMKTTAEETFGEQLGKAIEAFDKVFEDEKRGRWEKFGHWFVELGSFNWEWDNNFEQAIEDAHAAYKTVVDAAIDTVAEQVETDLAAAAERVVEGREDVDTYVEDLDESLVQFGEEGRAEVAADFDELTTTIDSARSALIESLVAQYQESQNELARREHQLREENKSWWQKAWDATVGAAQKVLEFKNLLLELLAGAMEIVLAIIADPIQFLKNLIAGIMGGLMLFKDNIVEHLKGGLMGWLVGSLESAGIELPTKFDVKGIFQLIFGVLGLTYQAIRDKAVGLVGEKTVSRLEQTAEIFMVLVTEGPAGLWRMFVEQIGDVKEMIMEQIRNFVIEKIVIAGITWLVSLLNPASAFFKACKAIYDIIMFFIERGQQIMELVTTIIGAIGEIVAGNIKGMSQAVENVLARILPVAISFLASLLGLNGITDKIREIVEKIREKVDAVVDWIIAKAVKLAQKIGDLLPGGKERKAKREAEAGEKEDEPDYGEPEKEAEVTAALADIDRLEAARSEGGVTEEEAEGVAAKVVEEHKVIKSIKVEPGKGHWVYHYSASNGKRKIGSGKRSNWPDKGPRVVYGTGLANKRVEPEERKVIGVEVDGGYAIDNTDGGNEYSKKFKTGAKETAVEHRELDKKGTLEGRRTHILSSRKTNAELEEETKGTFDPAEKEAYEALKGEVEKKNREARKNRKPREKRVRDEKVVPVRLFATGETYGDKLKDDETGVEKELLRILQKGSSSDKEAQKKLDKWLNQEVILMERTQLLRSAYPYATNVSGDGDDVHHILGLSFGGGSETGNLVSLKKDDHDKIHRILKDIKFKPEGEYEAGAVVVGSEGAFTPHSLKGGNKKSPNKRAGTTNKSKKK